MLTVVTGSPCSGKTTWVTESRKPEDIVVDMDALAHALGYPDTHIEWDTDHPARRAAQIARVAVVNALTSGKVKDDAWVIDSAPHPTSLHIYQRAGAKIVRLNPGRAACHERATASGRSASTHVQIDAWHDAHGHRGGALSVFG